MGAMEIIVSEWKPVKYGFELPKRYRRKFDYIDDKDFDTEQFVKYGKDYYWIGDFETTKGTQFERYWER